MKKYKAIFAIVLASLGFGLLILDYLMPPRGEFSTFTIFIFAEILQFSAGALGFDYNPFNRKDEKNQS